MPTENAILVTGGAGYIGSHTVVELLEADNNVVVVDNLCNSSKAAISRVEKIAGKKIELIGAAVAGAAFLATTFLAAGFLATAFLAAGFLAAAFLTVAFLAAGFLAVAFLAAPLRVR